MTDEVVVPVPTSVNAWLGIFGPPTDKKGLCVWVGEKIANSIGQIIWKPVWQAFVTNEIMNNPPTVATLGDTLYAFYPSTSNQTNYLYYNTCNTNTLEWSSQEILTFYDAYVPGNLASVPTGTGAGAAAFNGQMYVFWQGVNSSGTGNAGTLFYRTMSSSTYHQINAQQSVDGKSAGVIMSNCPSAVVFNGSLYVFYQGPGDDTYPWYSVSSDGSTWSASTKVPGTCMSTSPSTVVFTNPSTGNESLYLFHEGNNSNGQLWFNVLDADGSWSGDTQVPNVSMSAVPSAGIYDGMLYVFYQGSNTSTFWYTYSADGSTWNGPFQVANLKISYAPSIVEFNSQIYCLVQGPGNDKVLWFSAFTPGSSNSLIPMTALPSGANATQRGPSAVVSGGNICCFAESPSTGGALLGSVFNVDTGWEAQSEILGGGTMSSAPSAVVFGPYTYIFFQGNNNSLQSFIWGEWDGPVQVPNVKMTSSPSAVVFNKQLYVFYNTTSNTVAYSISNTQGGQSSSWSDVNTVPINTAYAGINNSVAPFAVVYNDELYVFYMGSIVNDDLFHNGLSYYTLSTSGQWSGWYCLPGTVGWSEQNGQNFSPGPAAGAFVSSENELFVVYQNGSGELYYVSRSGSPSSSAAASAGWSAPVELSYQLPQSTPPMDGTVMDWAVNLGFFLTS